MNVIGRIIKRNPAVTGTRPDGTEWKKSSVIVCYGEYDDKEFELTRWNDTEAFDALPMGVPINFTFDLTSRENNGRYFTEARAHRWEIIRV